MLDDFMAGPSSMRRNIPPQNAQRAGPSFSAFRWQLDNWVPGPRRETEFAFLDGRRFWLRNQQGLDKPNIEIVFRPADPPIIEEVWYIEATFHNAMDSQQSVVIYASMMVSPRVPEVVLVVPILVTQKDNFMFRNNTLVIDFRFSDERFSSMGEPPLLGSTTAIVHEPVPFAGLLSSGNSSYVNCIVQTLYHIPEFRAMIYGIPRAEGVLMELQRLFGGLQESAKTCSTRLLMRAVSLSKTTKWSEAGLSLHRGADDFLHALIEMLKYSGETGSRIVNLFQGKLISTPIGMSHDQGEPKIETFEVLTLDVRGCTNLEEAIIRLVSQPAMRDDNHYDHVDRYPPRHMSIEFMHLPPVLFINLLRFEMNPMTGRREKMTDYMSFPYDIDMSHFVSDTSSFWQYELFSVLVHSGSTGYGGHYMSYIRTAPCEQWYQFSDSSVTEASQSQATIHNFDTSVAQNAFMLMYVKKTDIPRVFQSVTVPERVRQYVSEVKVRSSRSSKKAVKSRLTRTVKVLRESDFKKAILEEYLLVELVDIPLKVEIEENDTNHELYIRVATELGMPVGHIRLWKVGPSRLPTISITDNLQKFVGKDMEVYVQELRDPPDYFDKSMRMAFISFFFPHATPRVQCLCATSVDVDKSVIQLVPIVCSLLHVDTIFQIYCEGIEPVRPMHNHIPLRELQMTEAGHYIFEGVPAFQPHYPVSEFYRPRDDLVVSYYSMIRPNGDENVYNYLERRSGQLIINLYSIADPVAASPAAIISAPSALLVSDWLPNLMLFAITAHTRDQFDEKRDTFQVFRRKVDSSVNELTPYSFRSGVALRSLFVSELKRLVKDAELKLFYDIVHGYTPDQLSATIMRTCDVYDKPLRRLQRVRYPMKHTDSLDMLSRYIRQKVFPCGEARFLIDEEGLIRFIHDDEFIGETQVLRFEVVPEDQRHMGRDEFLVIMTVFRASKHRKKPADQKTSFLFRVVPQEVTDITARRIVECGFSHERIIPFLTFMTSSGRILNGDECLADFVHRHELVKVILPDLARENNLLKDHR